MYSTFNQLKHTLQKKKLFKNQFLDTK